jgi:hypothetical protein
MSGGMMKNSIATFGSAKTARSEDTGECSGGEPSTTLIHMRDLTPSIQLEKETLCPE